jgi:TusA-related sulfurtransferase
MQPTVELDVRGLEHPEPLERSVKVLKKMKPDDLFRLVIHRMPQPLLMIAERHGIGYLVCQKSDDEWHIWFSKEAERLDPSLCGGDYVQ